MNKRTDAELLVDFWLAMLKKCTYFPHIKAQVNISGIAASWGTTLFTIQYKDC